MNELYTNKFQFNKRTGVISHRGGAGTPFCVLFEKTDTLKDFILQLKNSAFGIHSIDVE